MHRLTSAMCWLILGTWLVPASRSRPRKPEKKLQGTWTATKAERDGKAADDVVGHRLSLPATASGSSPRTASPSSREPFRWTQREAGRHRLRACGRSLKGKAWTGIYALDGDTLTICDNAPNLAKGRPAAFEAKRGCRVCPRHVQRAKP